MKRIKFDPMIAIFLAISVATASHTIVASSYIFEGPLPPTSNGLETAHWYLAGVLVALAIDVGMYLTARKIERQPTLMMFFAFLATALASFFCQLVYAAQNTAIFTFGEGVSKYWITNLLQQVIDFRVIALPLVLPAFALIFTIANLQHARTMDKQHVLDIVEKKPNANTNKEPLYFHCKQCGFNSKPFKRLSTLQNKANEHIHEHLMDESLQGNPDDLLKKTIEFAAVEL